MKHDDEKPRWITWRDGEKRVVEPAPRTFGRMKPRSVWPPIAHALAMGVCVVGGVMAGWAFFALMLALG